MKKKLLAAALTVLSISAVFPAYGAGWQKDPSGYRWEKEDGTFVMNGWAWLDGNQDQVAECYYFDKYGYMLRNTETPDGYKVNPDGSWIVDGVVQSRHVGEEADRAGVITGRTYVNSWLGCQLELPAPAHFSYRENNTDLLDVQVKLLGEESEAAVIHMGFTKIEEGESLKDNVSKLAAELGETKEETGVILGDGNTYTKVTSDGEGKQQVYWIRISGDYAVVFSASYADEYKEAVDTAMAAIKAY